MLDENLAWHDKERYFMNINIRPIKPQDYDRVSYIMDQVQQLHVDWRPDVYRQVSPLITRDQL